MEALLKALEENQQMTEAGKVGPSKPSAVKYVSMFRIDGTPILPPLMTSEKRKQMHKYKEKAIRVEQELTERRMQKTKSNDGIDDKISETSRSSTNNCSGNISQRSQDIDEVKYREAEESLTLLHNLIEGQDESEKKDTGLQGSCRFANKKHDADNCKLKKLQKSETLIYDNIGPDVVTAKTASAQKRTLGECKRQLLELERKANLNYLQPKKPKFLLMPNQNKMLNPSIPTICVNPPTPVVDIESANQSSIDRESTDSLTISETPPKSTVYPDDSDESLSSLLVHSGSQSTHTSPRNKDDMEDFKKSSISAKIQKFEAISGQNYTPTSSLSATTTTTTPVSSPEKNNYAEPITGCMSRSATSPSLKLLTGNRLPGSPRIGLQMETEVTQQIPLVRSTSFTLEGPSKVLIDHMRQQNQTVDDNNSASTKMTTAAFIAKKAYHSRATSDTVESKAKKVHKVESKPSRSKVQLKNSSSKLIVSSTSPYNTPISSHNYCHNVNKNKRSPYEPVQLTKNCSTSFQSAHKFSTQSRKSVPPNTVARKPIKSRNSAAGMQAAIQQNNDNSQKQKQQQPNNQEFLSNMDIEQKEKFLKLLAQQEEEKLKLERAFELQQKFLLEQLTKEMANTHVHSPNSSSSAPSTLTNHNESAQLNISGYSLNFAPPQSGYSKNSLQSTLSSPTLSVNSSFVSILGIPPQPNTTLATYNTSNLSPTSIVATIPSNSSMNNKTVPYSRKSGCPIVPTASGMNNTVKNLTPRRRLFVQDNNVITTPSQTNPLSSVASLRKPESLNTIENNIGTHSRERRVTGVLAEYWVFDKAATKINAYARGFLVRRLLRTEQIQRIVRTIRDTLIFVLNLHFETCENPDEANEPENIKLKARLLQQLTSASRSLHSYFFELSIKDRLDIIAQDRKRIKNKLAALSKKMLSQTLNSTISGSTYRLTLSPLILALNTLVAEFLYAQNCHYTLSVFCTEVPFRNALPDFERMRNFRFNEYEIADIWEAIIGSSLNLKGLYKSLVRNYFDDRNNSLLLLILKYLLRQRPEELLKRTVDVQTDFIQMTNNNNNNMNNNNNNNNHRKLTATQVSDCASTSSSKKLKKRKETSFHQFKRYLETLSKNVYEMNSKFDEVVNRKPAQRVRQLSKSVRRRDYWALSRNLQKITENLKQTSVVKRKNKRMQVIAAALENLTAQFSLCADSFRQLWLQKNEQEAKEAKRSENLIEKQTETDIREKSYTDWIYEMRNTSNGKKFLNRVDSSLRKALAQHKDQLENEMKIKWRHIKGLMKLHYKEKLLKHLSSTGKQTDTIEVQKLNESIEAKLRQFERTQAELLEKIQTVSAYTREVQQERIAQDPELEQKLKSHSEELPVVQQPMNQTRELGKPLRPRDGLLKDVLNTQKQLHKVFANIKEQEHNVNNIICDSKLRLQQLEYESNQIEQNFLSYLEKQKQDCIQKEKQNKNVSFKPTKVFKKMNKIPQQHIQKDDNEYDEEFLAMKLKLDEIEKRKQLEQLECYSTSSTSSADLRNAVVEAKTKFFENESKFRQKKHLELLVERLNSKKSHDNNGDDENYDNENNDKTEEKPVKAVYHNNTRTDHYSSEFVNHASISDISTVEQEPNDNNIRQKFYPKMKSLQNQEKNIMRQHKPVMVTNEDVKNALDDLKTFATQITTENYAATNSDVLKQSMVKMKKLFEQDTPSKSDILQSYPEEDHEDVFESFSKNLNTNLVTDFTTTTTTGPISSRVITTTTTTTTFDTSGPLSHITDVKQQAVQNKFLLDTEV
uniref:Uncharacterized protein n=1 Tax=Glossina brevipalpis TaxID=37001 RepID=A0A1A9WVP0_9MUSC